MNDLFLNILKRGGIVLLFFLSACSEEDAVLTVGEDWTNTSTNVYFIDTVTVKASTFQFDSISVSGTNRLLIGAYSDPVFGMVKSEAYMQLTASDFTIDSEAAYDSVALILKYDGYFYNDTLQPQKFIVTEVLEDIEPDDTYYYNTTNFKSSEENLAVKSFTPFPKSEDSLHIRLDKNFGKSLFDKLQTKNITSSDEFLREYRGLLVKADTANTSILGFSKESLLRIYYTIPGETEDEEMVKDFSLSSTNSFHHISSNFNGTYFSAIEDQETYLSSSDTEDQSFVQAGVGMATRIDIPYLEQLNNIGGTGVIVDANLKISLDRSNTERNHFTRDSLQFYIVNQRSEILDQLYDYNSAVVLGRIAEEEDEFNVLTYTVPLKYYLDTKATDNNGDNWFLTMYSQDYNASVDRYIFQGEQAPNDVKIKLELTYALYDE